MSPGRSKRLAKVGGAAIGSAMAGVDGAAFRSTPPPLEMVVKHRRSGPIATGDGKFVIALPNESTREDRPDEVE